MIIWWIWMSHSIFVYTTHIIIHIPTLILSILMMHSLFISHKTTHSFWILCAHSSEMSFFSLGPLTEFIVNTNSRWHTLFVGFYAHIHRVIGKKIAAMTAEYRTWCRVPWWVIPGAGAWSQKFIRRSRITVILGRIAYQMEPALMHVPEASRYLEHWVWTSRHEAY